MLTICGKALGRKKPLFDDFSVPAPKLGDSPFTLRALLDHVVRQEVAAFQHRQADRRLIKALSSKEISEQLAAGKVSAGGSDLDQKVNPDEAVATAIEAFADGLFMVIVDETEVRELDAVVPVTETSRLTFIRLVMLAGG